MQMILKKCFLLVMSIFAVAAMSCKTQLEERESELSGKKKIEYASLKIISSISDSRNLDINEIKFASIRVSGCDIAEDKEPHLDFIDIVDGINSEEILIENVPVGIDRIISVYAYDENRKELPLFQMRAVCDIKSGKNDVKISKKTTTFGNVLYGIKGIFNFEELEADGRMDTVRHVIDEEIPPSLFNTKKLIGELQGFSFPWDGTPDDYELECGTIQFNYLIADNFSVSVNDPISPALTGQNPGNGILLEGVAPGNWTLTVRDKDGKILDQTRDIQVESGKTTKLGHLDHDGVTLLVRQGLKKNGKECSTLYYWGLTYDETVPASEQLPPKSAGYPGEELVTKITVENPIDEQNGNPDENHGAFYVKDFKKASGVKLILSNGNSGDSNKYTPDLEVLKKGVYCVHSTSLIPLTEVEDGSGGIDSLSIKEEHFKKCFIDDPKNKRFVVLLSEKLYGSSITSAKAEFNKGINDHDENYSGKHYKMIRKDGDNPFWYCEVPYADVQETNQCGQPSYNFKVNDNFIAPPAFVESGYIYQKFEGSTANKKFLVLIYSYQNEAAITARLENAKKCKKLRDFDLSKEEDQKKISNFRLTAGTTTLYRSFHPYSDDKKNISDTSEKRMACLTALAEKAGIKADINLSDSSLSTVTYGSMPAYYSAIINNNAVLYMTDCSYNVCYSESNGDKFANGIKKIVNFINGTEGPYLIHCRIGTDRTGVTCAVLAGLCGATIEEIEEDYCSSVEMGIYEYRGPGAVRYALQNLLGVTFIEDAGNLEAALKNQFISRGFLTEEQINEMKRRLTESK